MSAVVHGGLDEAELRALGMQPDQTLDFSSNINPFGPPAAVRQALAALDPAPYPDRGARELRGALAERHGCSPAEVMIGAGALELIHLVARALLIPGDRALVVEPTFGEYAHASRLAGAVVTVARTDAADSFRIDPEALVDQVTLTRPRILWLCSPNNPTGSTVGPLDIRRLAQVCGEVDGYLVLDAAYAGIERSGANESGLAMSRALVVHSLTKAYAIAGLRLGYLLACERLVTRIMAYQPAWSINSAAQVAGLAALQDPGFLPETLPRWWAASDALRSELTGLGLPVMPSALPFFLVRMGVGARVRAALLRDGCLVRDCASFGLPEYVRVCPRVPEENQRLIEAWRSICRRK